MTAPVAKAAYFASRASTPGATSKASGAAPASASTPGVSFAPTPHRFAVDCAIWNVGMPESNSFSAQPEKAKRAKTDTVKLLRRAQIVGLNEVHTAHHSDFDNVVTSQLSNISHYGSVSGDMLFWCPPQSVSEPVRQPVPRRLDKSWNHSFPCRV